ncbi:MAG TPA: hypothetical protein VE127_05625 [Solirubrobacteraceae bacterium]|nr:hypothetical protein [Solirubrobacteraceae bacterium]
MTATLSRGLRGVGGAGGAFLVVLVGLFVGTGWVYVLRGLQWLDVGPRVADALPLLALASFDGQPLVRVIVAWLLAGVLVGVALVRVRPGRRALLTGVLGLLILLVAAQAADALTRNLNFEQTLFSHWPGLGPILEALAFAAGSALPGAVTDRHRHGLGRALLARVGGIGDRGLRGG